MSPSGTVTGTAYGWFNTLGGSPTITHTFATGVYTIDFPGIGNVLHYVFQASLDIHGEITAGSAGGGTHVLVGTYDDAGAATDGGFNITIYAASNSG